MALNSSVHQFPADPNALGLLAGLLVQNLSNLSAAQ